MSLEGDNAWIRGTGLDDRRRVIDSAMGDQRLFDAMTLGTEALQLMQGTARHGQAVACIASLILSCEAEVQQLTRQLIALDDPGSAEARELHFRMRVNAAIIGRFNRFIHEGQRAGEALNNRGPDA